MLVYEVSFDPSRCGEAPVRLAVKAGKFGAKAVMEKDANVTMGVMKIPVDSLLCRNLQSRTSLYRLLESP